MSIKLTSTAQAAVDNGIKVLVHGPAGSGKTTLCATTGEPTVIISAEAGLLSLRGHDIPMQHLLTDNRLVTFRAIEVEPSPIGGESGPSHPMEEDHA